MKRRIGEKRDHFKHRLFMTRTMAVWQHHRELGKRLGQKVDYDLIRIRAKVQAVLAASAYCSYCYVPLTERNFSLDHDLPLARGGTFALSNLRVICMRCNDTKGALRREEFMYIRALEVSSPEGWQDVARRLRAGGKALRVFMGRGRREPTPAAST